MKKALFAFAAVSCSGGDCSCGPIGATIHSASASLVSASGCEHAALCVAASPCDWLLINPPANGGTCTITVSFADGSSTTVTADFGAMHPSTGCCGNYYDNTSFVVNVK